MILPIPKPRALTTDEIEALVAIAEGSPVRAEDDRFIIVENPEYQPNNWHDPYLVIDTASVRGLDTEDEAE